MSSKFTVVKPGPGPIKVLLYGLAKSGKTQAALTFPRPIIIDSENGSRLFVGRNGLDSLPTLVTTKFDELLDAVEEVKADGGKNYETLIIDSISIFYDALIYDYLKDSRTRRVSTDQWNYIHSRLRHLFTVKLADLKINVVVIGRQVPLWETQTGPDGKMSPVRTNAVKINADPMIRHFADCIIQMQSDHSGRIEAMRGVTFKPDKFHNVDNVIAEVTYARLRAKLASLRQSDKSEAQPDTGASGK